MCQDEYTVWINTVKESKGLCVDKSWRQKKNVYVLAQRI